MANEKKAYAAPTVDVVEFDKNDVIATSDPGGDWCYIIGGDNTEYCKQQSDWFEGMKKVFG